MYENKEEAKLNVIMNNDPEMAEMYRDTYNDIKNEKESYYNQAARIHNKYSYLDDEEFMSDKKPNKYGDILKSDRSDAEEPYFSTDMTDDELDLIYKRYKMLQFANKTRQKDLDEEAEELR